MEKVDLPVPIQYNTIQKVIIYQYVVELTQTLHLL
jgi:hypothetical protein